MDLILLLALAGIVALVVIAAVKHNKEERENLMAKTEQVRKDLQDNNYGAIKIEKSEFVPVEGTSSEAVVSTEKTVLAGEEVVVSSKVDTKAVKTNKKTTKKTTKKVPAKPVSKIKKKPNLKVVK